jgi:hypothetical protein
MVKSEATKVAGLTYYVREDGVLVYKFADFRRETMDLRSLYLVGDLVLTLYAISLGVETARKTPPTLRESMAVVAPRGLVWTLFRNLFRRLPPRQQQSIHIFATEAEALVWLQEREHLLAG